MRAILTALGRLLHVRRQNKRNVEEMERQVLLFREKVRYLQVIAMRPGHSAEDLERLRRLERAARAQVKQRASEIAFVKGKQRPGIAVSSQKATKVRKRLSPAPY
jgi:hypothetical protein